MAEKIRFKPLEWKRYNLYNRAYSQTVCSAIASFGYADVSKNKKGYRAFFQEMGKHFNTLEEAKEYIEKAHQENILNFIQL